MPAQFRIVAIPAFAAFAAEEPTRKGNPRKLFTAEVTPRSSAGDAWGEANDDEVGRRSEEPPPDDYDDVGF